MNNFIKQTNSQQRLFAIIYIVFGIILCFFNKGILIMAARVLGVILLAYGILELYIYFVRRQNVTAIPLYTGLPCTLVNSGRLDDHLTTIERLAEIRMDKMLPQMMEVAGATEELKARDQMAWLGLVNNCRARAEEIICTELIYI